MDWDTLRAVTRDERLPTALVDLDALERNVDLLRSRVQSGRTVRVASKSVRHRGILRRILARGGERFRGVLAYSVEEASWLSDEGFDDLLIAYPSVQRAALAELAARVARGRIIRPIVDCRDHLEAVSGAARAASTVVEVVIDLDVSYRPAGDRLHVGVRRSPLRNATDVAALARAARSIPGVRVVGLMGYEAHVAGLPDHAAGAGRARDLMVRALKAAAFPKVVELRQAAVEALRSEGVEVQLVNGGGTGSARITSGDSSVTEVAIGSGFLCSHLFDGYADLPLEPAQYFALEVVRIPDRDHVTCAGGGYVASGWPGPERLPVPHLPRGLRWLELEGAGEVQSPLDVRGAERAPRVGDPVFFRHAKAGELAERFGDYLLFRKNGDKTREPTYRGEGKTFF